MILPSSENSFRVKQTQLAMDAIFYEYAVTGGIDHVRVHPKFLHSNATSHKWALGGIDLLKLKCYEEIFCL